MKRLRYYDLSIIISIPVSMMISISFVYQLNMSQFVDKILGNVTLNPDLAVLIGIILIMGPIVSGASYIGSTLDALDNPSTHNYYEKLCTLFGILIGLSVAAILIQSGISIPFLDAIPIIPALVFVLIITSSFAGLASRTGKVVDYQLMNEDTSPPPEANPPPPLNPAIFHHTPKPQPALNKDIQHKQHQHRFFKPQPVLDLHHELAGDLAVSYTQR